jgi:hypothetical protein
MMLNFLILMMVGGCAAVTAADTAADLEAAAEQVNAEVSALKASGIEASMVTDRQVIESLSEPERKAIEQLRAAAGLGRDAEKIREELRQISVSMFGHDVISETITGSLGANGRLDPTAAMTFQSGPQGLLWVFWAWDAPGIEYLPRQLVEAQKIWPQLIVRDALVMRMSDWRRLIKGLWDLKTQLEGQVPGEDPNLAISRKRALRDSAMPPLSAATSMANTRRDGGYLLIEDQTPAISWDVHSVPTLVFLSPGGVVHRSTGLTPKQSIAEWMSRALMWERQNQAVLRARGDLK